MNELKKQTVLLRLKIMEEGFRKDDGCAYLADTCRQARKMIEKVCAEKRQK